MSNNSDLPGTPEIPPLRVPGNPHGMPPMSHETLWIEAADPFAASFVVAVQGLREPHQQVFDRRSAVAGEVASLIESLAIPTEPSSEPLRIVVTFPWPARSARADEGADPVLAAWRPRLVTDAPPPSLSFAGRDFLGSTSPVRLDLHTQPASLLARTRSFMARLFGCDWS